MDVVKLIAEIAVTVFSVGAPIAGVLTYKKWNGNRKYVFAKTLILDGIEALRNYFSTHPDIQAEGQMIFDFIKSRVLAVLPLSDSEFNYLFLAVEQTIANLLGVSIDIFKSVSIPTIKLSAFKQHKIKRLFAA